jgi:hypothetical protein
MLCHQNHDSCVHAWRAHAEYSICVEPESERATMKRTLLIVLAAVCTISTAAVAQDTVVTAPGAKLEKLAGDFKFTEGPAADADGNVVFTDQPNDRILKWSTDGTLSTSLQPCGRSNGLCFDDKGNLWACADEKNEQWIVSGRFRARFTKSRDKSAAGPGY